MESALQAMPSRLQRLIVALRSKFDRYPLPPRELRFMGESDERFLKTGNKLLSLLEDAGFSETSDLLDVGSGYGRVAHAILRNMNFRGNYVGFDILAKHVKWCQENITPRNDRLIFRHLDIQNDRYNRGGTLSAENFVFDFPDERFDFCCLFSVFTHLYEAQIDNYLRQIHRVLKRRGVCIATFFYFNQVRLGERYAAEGLSMEHQLNEHTRYHNPDDPLHAIAYEESFVKNWIDRHGFELLKVIPGSWKGEPSSEYQDVFVFSKR